jgi:hypothetical protein
VLSFFSKPPWLFSRNPDMKVMGRAVDFLDMKEKDLMEKMLDFQLVFL